MGTCRDLLSVPEATGTAPRHRQRSSARFEHDNDAPSRQRAAVGRERNPSRASDRTWTTRIMRNAARLNTVVPLVPRPGR